MDNIALNDSFFTQDVMEYMRHRNLENISFEENLEVLEAIIEVYSPRLEVRFEWTEVSNVHEVETAYLTHKELMVKRREAACLVAADANVATLNWVFAILSHKERGFKEEYKEREAQAQRNSPALVEKLRKDFFLTGYYPGRDQSPQTAEEWVELLADINEDDCISDEEVRRVCNEWLTCA